MRDDETSGEIAVSPHEFFDAQLENAIEQSGLKEAHEEFFQKLGKIGLLSFGIVWYLSNWRYGLVVGFIISLVPRYFWLKDVKRIVEEMAGIFLQGIAPKEDQDRAVWAAALTKWSKKAKLDRTYRKVFCELIEADIGKIKTDV